MHVLGKSMWKCPFWEKCKTLKKHYTASACCIAVKVHMPPFCKNNFNEATCETFVST